MKTALVMIALSVSVAASKLASQLSPAWNVAIGLTLFFGLVSGSILAGSRKRIEIPEWVGDAIAFVGVLIVICITTVVMVSVYVSATSPNLSLIDALKLFTRAL